LRPVFSFGNDITNLVVNEERSSESVAVAENGDRVQSIKDKLERFKREREVLENTR
jgi:hypothetical protein